MSGKGLKQCLCGLQGINDWEGACGLLVGVFAVWLCVGWNECGGERRGRREIAEGAEGMRGRTQKAQKLRRSRKRNTKIVWKRLEPVFMRVAGHKWLGRRMGAGCRYFAALLCVGWKDTGQRRKRRRGYAEVAEGTPNCLKRLASSIHAGCRPKMAGKAHGCWLLGFCR